MWGILIFYLTPFLTTIVNLFLLNRKDTCKLFDVHTCLFCIILYFAFCCSYSTRLIVNRDEEQ